MNRDQFEELLHKGVVEFVFEKRDGSERQAVGTLHPSHLPIREPDIEAQRKAEEKRRNNPDLVTYWDIEAGAFRSLHLDKLLVEPRLTDEL